MQSRRSRGYAPLAAARPASGAQASEALLGKTVRTGGKRPLQRNPRVPETVNGDQCRGRHLCTGTTPHGPRHLRSPPTAPRTERPPGSGPRPGSASVQAQGCTRASSRGRSQAQREVPLAAEAHISAAKSLHRALARVCAAPQGRPHGLQARCSDATEAMYSSSIRGPPTGSPQRKTPDLALPGPAQSGAASSRRLQQHARGAKRAAPPWRRVELN